MGDRMSGVEAVLIWVRGATTARAVLSRVAGEDAHQAAFSAIEQVYRETADRLLREAALLEGKDRNLLLAQIPPVLEVALTAKLKQVGRGWRSLSGQGAERDAESLLQTRMVLALSYALSGNKQMCLRRLDDVETDTRAYSAILTERADLAFDLVNVNVTAGVAAPGIHEKWIARRDKKLEVVRGTIRTIRELT
ncbi:hypothetical protein [Streptomyces sp. NPDC001070]